MRKSTIELKNMAALAEEKLEKNIDWSIIYEKVKNFPYYGLIEIELFNDIHFTVLSMNDDVLALRYFWTGGGLTEPESFCTWQTLSKHARGIIDAGAYTGFYSLLAASQNKCPIYAYQPVNFIYGRLASNALLNKFYNISLRNKALSVTKDVQNISIRFGPRLFSSGSSLSGKGIINQPCQVTSIDIEHENDIIDLIKIDVEGIEIQLIKGSKHILTNQKPILILETRSDTHQESMKILNSYGYNLKELGDTSGAKNFLCWHSDSYLTKWITYCFT